MSRTPRIAVLAGDGIGPEVTAVARRVAEATGLQADWEDHPVGWNEWCLHGEALSRETLDACRRSDAVLFGAITSKPETQAEKELAPHLQETGLRYHSPILRLRQALGLHVNVRPVLGNGLDLTIFRENSEGLYTGHEARPVPSALQSIFPGIPDGPETAVGLRLVTRQAIERVSRAAFEHARHTGRDRVTLVEKPNVLRVTGGLVRETFQAVANEYPGIEIDEANIDAACALLVREGGRFQTLVATNLFGDILSDLAAELAGGLSLAASANLGDSYALFEPVHGSAPTIAGRDQANPTGAVRAAALMADHLGQHETARKITQAVDRVVQDSALRTREQGGTAGTRKIESALFARLEQTATAS